MRAALAAVLLIATLSAAPPAHALVAVAGPVAEETGFATPVVVVPHGQSVTFLNADPASYFHDFWAHDAFLPKNTTARWCLGFPLGRCPAFWSATISEAQTTPVLGVDKLAAGQYTFYCSLHETMKGTLVVV